MDGLLTYYVRTNSFMTNVKLQNILILIINIIINIILIYFSLYLFIMRQLILLFKEYIYLYCITRTYIMLFCIHTRTIFRHNFIYLSKRVYILSCFPNIIRNVEKEIIIRSVRVDSNVFVNRNNCTCGVCIPSRTEFSCYSYFELGLRYDCRNPRVLQGNINNNVS